MVAATLIGILLIPGLFVLFVKMGNLFGGEKRKTDAPAEQPSA